MIHKIFFFIDPRYLADGLFPSGALNGAHLGEDHTVTEGHQHKRTGESNDAEKEEIVPGGRSMFKIISRGEA